ncbi:MAG: hypothetical protein ACE5FD_07745 [Anaerolineae bacterium]
MPFAQATDEVQRSQRTEVTESTLRGVTHRYGEMAEAIERAEAERIERERPQPTTTPERLLVSEDGAFIHLTTGEWREVKTMVIGEIESTWQEKAGEVVVKTKNLSYFSRSYKIREFERYALAELHRRGLENAKEVITVNDGSQWIESFADYHFPKAVRIIDFRHATEYIAAAGKAALGEDSAEFSAWFAHITHQLKHKPPRQTIADICHLQTKVDSDDKLAIIDDARRYLQKREKMIDYPHFQAHGFPIGSGSVESSHKLVVQSRMKQSGMRWAEHHVDPMLALRNLVCNGRWSQGWSQIVAFYWQQRRQEFHEQAKKQRPHLTRITFDSVMVAPDSAQPQPSEPVTKRDQPYRPAPDHPWRQGIWPTREAWRWN